MNFISGRLKRLEERITGGGPCPECGDRPLTPKLIAIWDEDIPEEQRFSSNAEIPEGEQFCPECGRQQWVIFRMVYDR